MNRDHRKIKDNKNIGEIDRKSKNAVKREIKRVINK